MSAEAELEGLDMPEMGALGYPDFVLKPSVHGTVTAAPRAPKGAPVMQPARDNH